jgi:hypothetical protein
MNIRFPMYFHSYPTSFSVLVYDRAQGEALLTGGLDLKNIDALAILHCQPKRRLQENPSRPKNAFQNGLPLTAPTLLVWGKAQLIPPVYADYWKNDSASRTGS